jgi:hypothetical protein
MSAYFIFESARWFVRAPSIESVRVSGMARALEELENPQPIKMWTGSFILVGGIAVVAVDEGSYIITWMLVPVLILHVAIIALLVIRRRTPR